MASKDTMLERYCASMEYLAVEPMGLASRSKGSIIFSDAAITSQNDLINTAMIGGRYNA